MNRNVVFAVLLLSLSLLPQSARSDGRMFPRQSAWNAQRERALINEPAQKAAVFFRNGREQLIISPSYQGPAGDFAWVVPVPARPQVKILKGALFHELARIVEPAPPGRFRAKAAGMATHHARKQVTVLEREVVGAYDVSVLSATDGGALQAWLSQNGYFLPPSAKRPLAGYVRERWTFVACRVKAPAQARGLQSGTLAPLSLTFAAPKIVYPMRLSAGNPHSFSLVLYLLRPVDSPAPMPDAWPGGQPPTLRAGFARLAAGQYPTLAGLDRSAKSVSLFWLNATIAPQNCTRDYVWSLAARPRR